MSALRVGGLFAGYGGLELAVRRVFPQAEPAWFSEFGKAQSRILAHHWPTVPNLGDITAIDWSQVEPVDIITGGSPCQDMSPAGKRAGMREGTRSGLWSYMRAGIEALRPKLVVWENVRGALSACASSEADSDLGPCPRCVDPDSRAGHAPHLRAVGRVLGDLAGLGYDACWVGLRAADVGAPHGRFRIFVAAWPSEDPSALSWPSEDPSALSWPSEDPSALLPTPAVNDMGAAYTPETWDAWTERMREAHGNGNGHGASLHVEALRLLPTPTVGDARATRNSTARRRRVPPTGIHPGDTLTDVVTLGRWGKYAACVARWEALTRPAPDPTEPTGKHGAHRLAPRFSEWMMGLPDGWVTAVPGVGRNQQLEALGNGVVPQQGAEGIAWCLERAREAVAA